MNEEKVVLLKETHYAISFLKCPDDGDWTILVEFTIPILRYFFYLSVAAVLSASWSRERVVRVPTQLWQQQVSITLDTRYSARRFSDGTSPTLQGRRLFIPFRPYSVTIDCSNVDLLHIYNDFINSAGDLWTDMYN
jgi:hypothetical protein